MTDSHFHCTPALHCSGFRYFIAGVPNSYRFTIQTLSGNRLITSEPFPSIVAANQAAQQRIGLATVVLHGDNS